MTAAWMAATQQERQMFDDEAAAERWATEQVKANRSVQAVWWQVEVDEG